MDDHSSRQKDLHVGGITMDTNPAYGTIATIKMDTNPAYATTYFIILLCLGVATVYVFIILYLRDLFCIATQIGLYHVCSFSNA